MNHNARANSIKYTRILAFYIFLFSSFSTNIASFSVLCALLILCFALFVRHTHACAAFTWCTLGIQMLLCKTFLMDSSVSYLRQKSHGTPSWCLLFISISFSFCSAMLCFLWIANMRASSFFYISAIEMSKDDTKVQMSRFHSYEMVIVPNFDAVQNRRKRVRHSRDTSPQVRSTTPKFGLTLDRIVHCGFYA